MPSITRSRRLKPLLTLAVLILLTILYLTSSAHSTRNSPFYKNTVAALQKQHQQQIQETDNTRSDTSDAKLKQDLQDAGDRAKEGANRKGDEMRKKLGMEDIANGKQVPLQEGQQQAPKDSTPVLEEAKEKVVAEGKVTKDPATSIVANKPTESKSAKVKEGAKVEAADEDEDDEYSANAAKVDAELNSILKRSPSESFLHFMSTMGALTT